MMIGNNILRVSLFLMGWALAVGFTGLHTGQRLVSRQFIRRLMGGGFGSSPVDKGESRQEGNSPEVRPQIKEVKSSDACPCKSGAEYGDCCERYHKLKGQLLPGTVEEAVRARYSAYATGNAAYLVESTHPEHKDYKRHSESGARNPQKARKNWEKEIVSQNSEVFEFLKLEIVDTPKAPVVLDRGKHVGENAATECISFRVLVRARGDGTIVPFQETALFTKLSGEALAALERPLALGISGKKKSGKPSSALAEAEAVAYLYLRGEVGVMDEETTRRMVAEVPKYLSSSIRDQW